MSNVLASLVFRNADACFKALCTANFVTDTVVVVGNKPMRLKVGLFKTEPVALLPLPLTSADHGKGQGLWGRFVALLRRWTGRNATAAVTPSPKQAAAIRARAERTRRHRVMATLWLHKAVVNARRLAVPYALGAGPDPAFGTLKDRIIARFEFEAAGTLASIRAIYARLPADQAEELARDIIGPMARRYDVALARCRSAGMPRALCEEVEDRVWKGLKTEMVEMLADKRVPATVTDPVERAAQRKAIIDEQRRRSRRHRASRLGKIG
jgi:hypothetical protein